MLTGVHKVASPIVQMFQVHLLVWYFPCGTLLDVSALGEASPQLWATWSVHASRVQGLAGRQGVSAQGHL